jgi:DNA-binding NtrC family response regulator
MTTDDLLTAAPPAPPAARQLLGRSPQIRALIHQIRRVAPTDASVLIIGESGCGKELVARSIHEGGRRATGPFVAINCGAIAAALIEAEIFGYERGSFTGAYRAHQGVFERANGGTLFLDEITEMPPDLQTRLLRVLETQRFFRVGGREEIAVDVRVIAASNRCPLAAVKEGGLREDILYRVAVFPINVPPLRERGDDVHMLAEHFLHELNAAAGTDKRFSATSLQTLSRHGWPGNVRELRNAVERSFILADAVVELAPLTTPQRGSERTEPAGTGAALRVAVGSKLDAVERSLIEATLEYFDGNKKQTAEALGCSLKTLYNKLNGYTHEPSLVEG